MTLEFPDHFAGKFWQKREVVIGVNDQRLLSETRELVEVDHRADGQPDLAQLVQIDLLFDSLPYVAGRLSVPNNVGEIRRGVIEGRHLNARIVRARDERIARAQTRADQSEILISLQLQPIQARADIDHA